MFSHSILELLQFKGIALEIFFFSFFFFLSKYSNLNGFIEQVARNMRSFRNTVKGLEEVSVSCRGIERVQLLRRWLVALKEIERLAAAFAGTNSKDLLPDEFKDLPIRPTLVCQNHLVFAISALYLPAFFYFPPPLVASLREFTSLHSNLSFCKEKCYFYIGVN